MNALATRTKLAPGRGIFGFPEELVTTVRYTDWITLTSTSGSIAYNTYRMNSLYDPDYTGAGHQPYYFDQLAALYGRYTVVMSIIKTEFCTIQDATTTTQPAGPYIVGLVTDDDAGITLATNTLCEYNGAQSVVMAASTGGNNVKKLKTTFTPENNLGLPNTDDTCGAAVGSNPSSIWYATIWAQQMGTATTGNIRCKVDMEFKVRFSRLQNVAGS